MLEVHLGYLFAYSFSKGGEVGSAAARAFAMLRRVELRAPNTSINTLRSLPNLSLANQNMEHQRCYIYEPPQTEERASKRQRTSKYDPHAQLPVRLQTYRDVWSQQEERITVSQLTHQPYIG